MAVVIRLARGGSKHKPKYRIMVADSRRYVTGKYLEQIGSYIPKVGSQKEEVVLDMSRTNDWISKGAQPSDRVKQIIKLVQKT